MSMLTMAADGEKAARNTSSHVPESDVTETVTRGEGLVAGVVLVLLMALRWTYAHSAPWNSDEPQHLHVVWAWATGLLPYRDVFDNHSPLFQFLCAPIFAAFGERPDIVVPMRLLMAPLFGVSLWCIYRIGAAVFSKRSAWWAVVFAGLLPRFFFKMGEFRTDVLWTTLWLITLVVILSGKLTTKRLFFAGLVVGATFSVSMKTTLLMVVVAGAAGLTWGVHRHAHRIRLSWWKELVPCLLAALGGMVVVPALIVAFFAAKGALGPMYYCVIAHNTMPGFNAPAHVAKRLFSVTSLGFLPALALGWRTLPLVRSAPDRGWRRMFILLVAGLFYPLLHGLWPMITPQDTLPWYPLVCICAASGVIAAGDALAARWQKWMPATALALALLLAGSELVWMVRGHPPFARPNAGRVATLADVLRLTGPNEYVMDAKGESIFRPRPCYMVLENLTRKRLSNGMMKDDIAERLATTRTAVLIPTSRIPEKSREFVNENYVRVERLFVAGKILVPTEPDVFPFEVAITEPYTFLGSGKRVDGTLDGTQVQGSRVLEPGRHEFHRTSGHGPVALVWARAADQGFSPFHHRKS